MRSVQPSLVAARPALLFRPQAAAAPGWAAGLFAHTGAVFVGKVSGVFAVKGTPGRLNDLHRAAKGDLLLALRGGSKTTLPRCGVGPLF